MDIKNRFEELCHAIANSATAAADLAVILARYSPDTREDTLANIRECLHKALGAALEYELMLGIESQHRPDPKAVALAKLTDEEKSLLGLSQQVGG